MTHVCIAIPTCRREAALRDLLDALGRLAPLPVETTAEIVVLDNDPLGGARATVLGSATAATFPLDYVPVPDPGLSNVRNAALAVAVQRAGLLAMLDDDEQPEPQWLNELLRVHASTGAAVVVGPVRAVLPADAPRWFRAFREREYPNATDGASLRDGWSSNFLLDLTQIASLGVEFDPRLNHIGGEDQLFFRELVARGRSIRYAAAAIVWESLPPARRSLSAILKRSFRRGGSLTVCDRSLHGSIAAMSLRLLKGGGLVVIGSLKFLPVLVTRGFSPAVMLLCEIARGLGMVAAFFGLTYKAYGRRA